MASLMEIDQALGPRIGLRQRRGPANLRGPEGRSDLTWRDPRTRLGALGLAFLKWIIFYSLMRVLI